MGPRVGAADGGLRPGMYCCLGFDCWPPLAPTGACAFLTAVKIKKCSLLVGLYRLGIKSQEYTVVKAVIIDCSGLVWFGLFCLMTPGLSKDIRCHV